MSKIETLFETRWLSLKQITLDYPEGSQYIFSHANAMDGEAVAILPYRRSGDGLEFLLRKEIVPPWSESHSCCAVTGGHDQETPVQTAVKELREETGYVVAEGHLVFLTSVYSSKASDTLNHLFTVDLTGLEPETPEGDGSVLELYSSCYWTQDVLGTNDSLVPAMYAHVMSILS